jgi:hypothetical protein
MKNRPSYLPRSRLAALATLAFLLAVAATLPAAGPTKFPAARVDEIAALLPARPAGIGQPSTNRAAWARLAAQPAAKTLLTDAAKLTRQPLPASPEDLYLDFSRTGNRDPWQKVAAQRRGRIATLTLAEGLENQGRFLKPLAEAIAAVCAEKTWVMPAHDRGLKNFRDETVEMDLGASMLAWDLATADWLLGDRLAPATRALVRQNLDRRIFTPFRDMVEGRRAEIYWLPATHNWNAVCLAGITGAALATLDSPQQRALFAAAAEHYIRHFLSGFTPDGYCSEGLGYWNYGFGHFVLLGETLRQATGGQLDLLADPAARQPALFGRRAEILNGIYPSIADCSPGTRPDPLLQAFIDQRFGRATNAGGTGRQLPNLGSLYIRALYAFLPDPLPRATGTTAATDSPLRSWFNDGGVLLCRPAPGGRPFAASLKGGHNAEHHNHNDVGSFIVVLGTHTPITDPGAETYTARTFSAKRYDSDVLNSFGHAVPIVAGQLQKTGGAARAKVLRTDLTDAQDVLALDIRSAYAVPSLNKLERTFTFRRGTTPSLTVCDAVAFSQPESFETVLITWGDWKQVASDELLITDDAGAVRVKIDTGGRPFAITARKLEAKVHTRQRAQHLGIALNSPLREGTVTLTITPVAR